jgi:hypothetical protein
MRKFFLRFVALILVLCLAGGTTLPAEAAMPAMTRREFDSTHPALSEIEGQALAPRAASGGSSAFFRKPFARLARWTHEKYFTPAWRANWSYLLGCGWFISVGFGMQIVAEPNLVLAFTGLALNVGRVNMMAPLFMGLFAPIGAVLAPILNRNGFIGIQIFRAASAAIIAGGLLHSGPALPMYVFILCAAMTGIGQGVGVPIIQGLQSKITDGHSKESREHKAGINQLRTQSGRLVGTFLATAALNAFGGMTSFVINTCCYLTAAGLTFRIETHLDKSAESLWTKIDTSIRQMRQAIQEDRRFFTYMVFLGVSAFFGYGIVAQAGAAAVRLLHVGLDWQGHLQNTFVFGSYIACLVWTRERFKPYRPRFFLEALMVFGASELLFALSPWLQADFVLEFTAGFAYIWASLVITSAIQKSVHLAFTSIAFGPTYFCWYMGQSLGNLNTGFWADSRLGLRSTLFLNGLILLGFASWFRRYRGEQFYEPHPMGLWTHAA